MSSIKIRRLLVGAILWLLPAAAALGQGWPLPTQLGTPNPNLPALSCSGCPITRTNSPDQLTVVVSPTMQYSDPIVKFTGRWLDSAFTQDFQQTFRTARAWSGIPVESKGRLYFMIGSSVAAYNAKNFFFRLEAGEQLYRAQGLPIPNNYRPNDYSNERVLLWDKFFYVENVPSGWTYQIIDRQQTLWSFDVDDRSIVYLAAADEGWGLVQDDLSTGSNLMSSLFQDLTFPTVKRITALKGSSGKYYALLGDGMNPGLQVWDVTNPGLRAHIKDLAADPGITAKGPDHSASICNSTNLCIYANDDIIAGNPPLTIKAPGNNSFASVATDGSNFFASYFSSTNKTWGIAVLQPDGSGGYNEADTTMPGYVIPGGMTYASGHIAMTGYVDGVGSDIYLVRLTDTKPSLLSFNGFFAGYYQSPPSGFVNAHASAIYGTFPYFVNNKLYLVVSAFTLGDVYQIKTPDCGNVVAPSNLVASVASNLGSVSLTWDPVAGADYYQISRNSGTGYVIIDRTSSANYVDRTAVRGAAYAYRVAAVNSTAGCVSGFSVPDLATTVQFTDDPIQAGVTVVQAIHFDEIRSTTNLVRTIAGLPPAALSDIYLGGATISSTHISELRAAINEARFQLSIPQYAFTDDPVIPGVTQVRACHINQLRDALKAFGH